MAASHDIEIRTPCDKNTLLEFARGTISTLHEDLGIPKVWFMPRLFPVLEQGVRFLGRPELVLVSL